MLEKFGSLSTQHAWALAAMVAVTSVMLCITFVSIYGPPPAPFDPLKRCFDRGDNAMSSVMCAEIARQR